MIFKINYFLFTFAQVQIMSYTFIYAKYYAGISNVEFGALSMVLPTLALFAKPIACSLSDQHGIHKQFLLGSLAVFGLSFGSLAMLPFIKDRNNHDTDFITWIYICATYCVGYVSYACILCLNDTLASNYARKHNLSFGVMRIYACAGWGLGAVLVKLVGNVPWLPFRVPGLIVLIASIFLDLLALILWPYPDDFEMFHDGSTIEQRKLSIVGPNTQALQALKRPRGSITKDMLDRIKAGRSKSVGYIPKDMQIPSISSLKAEVDPSQVNMEVEEKTKEYSNFQCQIILMKLISSAHKSFMRFIFLFVVLGFIQGNLWGYQFAYIQVSMAKDDDDFEFLSTTAIVAQTIFGDIVVNAVATDLIRWFGTNANMSLALVCIGLRCFLYANIVPYIGIPALVLAEALQGPSLSLYFILIVEVGSHYALMVTDFMSEMKRRGVVRDAKHEEELSGCLRATMIGVMSASMEGLGVALGTFSGGLISNAYGYESMWNVCAGLGFVVGFVNIGWDIVRKLIFMSHTEPTYQLEKSSTILPVVIVEPPNPKDNSTKM